RLPAHPDGNRSIADQAVRRADGDRGGEARIHPRRGRRHRRCGGRGQFERGEHWRAAAADPDGAGAPRKFVPGPRPARRDGGDRRRLRAQAHRRPRQERGFEPVHSLTSSPSEHRRSMNTMKAVRLFEFGGPDKLRYGEHPMPGPTDVLVKVLATSVSRWDVKYRTGEVHEVYGNATAHHIVITA